MVTLKDVLNSGLLQKPSDEPQALQRSESNYTPLRSFNLGKDLQYQQQFADTYFLRLTKIKPSLEEVANSAWEGIVIGDETAKKVERVLDVRQGELCWVVGTVYMDMPAKPNILEDVSKDRWISAPSTVQKYYSDDGLDSVMLEDESGRIRLVGNVLKKFFLVTGCIIAAMGTENANGEFDVIDLKFADLPPQPERWELSKLSQKGARSVKKESKIKDEDVEMKDSSPSTKGKKIAIASGLEFSGPDTSYAMELNLLLEFLLGDILDPAAQGEIAQISRLIIAGNSIASEVKAVEEATEKKSHKKYGYDSTAYNAQPSKLFDDFISELLPTIPITLLPGVLDPANASYPQQPIHPAMFPRARAYTSIPGAAGPGWLDTVTNPWEGEVEGWRILGTSGQNLDDIFKYVDSDDRLGMMEATCRWRCSAPTAPDTLCKLPGAYPFQDDEPFVMKECPHLYFIGCQPEFGTTVITGPDGQVVRLVLIPSFSATREVVLVDMETLDISTVKFTA
ncbi:DNA polymerase alpha/epsilon subunit B-domain-containing protein [Lasiosphaeris hirsuta]|uniref:DNA-directed DNA polymerase n=1 Tax=Lasiosphaeris hirsuta TaxID=260670 RepID=A0AA40AQG1_9PEZI|nr:DNA polymerase alpha/epsilon subunit B-domain-containing protein [Lasiosphaeris hirsuta]